MATSINPSKKDVLQAILNCLVSIKKRIESGDYPHTGICYPLSVMMFDLHGAYPSDYKLFLSPIIESWPKHSGTLLHPVPSLNPTKYNAVQFYNLDAWEDIGVSICDHLWTGEYGALRIELLDFLIERLTQEVYQ